MSNKKDGSKRKFSPTQRKNKQDCEHKRREKLSQGFHDLEKLLPEYDAAQRWGKIEVIQRAVKYIRYLQRRNQQLLIGPKKNGRAEEIHRLQTQISKLKERNEHLTAFLRDLGVSRDLSKVSSSFGQKPNKFTLTSNPAEVQEGNEENVPLIVTHFREDSEKRPVLKKKKKAKEDGLISRSSSSGTSKPVSDPPTTTSSAAALKSAPKVSFTVKPLTLPIQGQSEGPSKIEVIAVRTLPDVEQDGNSIQNVSPNTSDSLKTTSRIEGVSAPPTIVSPGGTPARIENIVTPGAARIDTIVTPGAARIEGIVTPGAARLVTPVPPRIDGIVTEQPQQVQNLNHATSVPVVSSPELSSVSVPTPLPQPHELTQLIQSKMEEVAPHQNQAINIGRIESVFNQRLGGAPESFDHATALQPKNELKNGLLCKQATVNGIPGYIIFPPKQSQVLQNRGSVLDTTGMSFSQGNNTIQVVSQLPLQGGQINTPRGSILTQTLGNVPIMATGVTGAPNPGMALQVVNVPSQVVGMTQTYPGAVVPMGPCSFQLVANNSTTGNVPIVPKPENLSPVSIANKIPISNLHPHSVPYTPKAADKRAKNKQAMLNKRMKILGMKKEMEMKVEPSLSPSESTSICPDSGTSGNDILAFATKSIFTSSDMCDIEEQPVILNESVPLVIEENAVNSTETPVVINAEMVSLTEENEQAVSKVPISQKRKVDNEGGRNRSAKKNKTEETLVVISTKQGQESQALKVVATAVAATITTTTETTMSSLTDSPVVCTSVTEPQPPATKSSVLNDSTSPLAVSSSAVVSIPTPIVSIATPVVTVPSPVVSSSFSSVSNPITSVAKSIVSVSKPVASVSKTPADTNVLKPTVSVSEPSVSLPKATVSLPKSSAGLPKPTVSLPKPIASIPKPTVSLPKPAVSLPKPTVSISSPISSLSRSMSISSRPLGLKSEPRILCGGTDSKPMLDLLPDQDDSALIAEMTKNPKSLPQIMGMKDGLVGSLRLGSYTSKSPFYSSLSVEQPLLPKVPPEILITSQTTKSPPMEKDTLKNQPVESPVYGKPSNSTDMSSGLLSTLEKCVSGNEEKSESFSVSNVNSMLAPNTLNLEKSSNKTKDKLIEDGLFAKDLTLKPPPIVSDVESPPYTAPIEIPESLSLITEPYSKVSHTKAKTTESSQITSFEVTANKEMPKPIPLVKDTSVPATAVESSFGNDIFSPKLLDSSSPSSLVGNSSVETKAPLSNKEKGITCSSPNNISLSMDFPNLEKTCAEEKPSSSVARDGGMAIVSSGHSTVDSMSNTGNPVPVSSTSLPISTAPLTTCTASSTGSIGMQHIDLLSCAPVSIPSKPFTGPHSTASLIMNQQGSKTISSNYGNSFPREQSLGKTDTNAHVPPPTSLYPSTCLYTAPQTTKSADLTVKLPTCSSTDSKRPISDPFPRKNEGKRDIQPSDKDIFTNKTFLMPTEGKISKPFLETLSAGKSIPAAVETALVTTSSGNVYSSASIPITTNVTFTYNNSIVSSNNCKESQAVTPLITSTAGIKGESVSTSSSANKLARSKKSSYPEMRVNSSSCVAKSGLERDSLGSFGRSGKISSVDASTGRIENKQSPSNEMFQVKSRNDMPPSPFPTFFSSPDQSPSIGDKNLLVPSQPLPLSTTTSGATTEGFQPKDKVKEVKPGGMPNSEIAPLPVTSVSSSYGKPVYVPPSATPEAISFPTTIGSEMRYPLCTKNNHVTQSPLSYTTCPNTTASSISPALSLPNFTTASSAPLLVSGGTSQSGPVSNMSPLLSPCVSLPLPVMGTTPSLVKPGPLAVNPSYKPLAKPSISNSSLGQLTLPPSTCSSLCLGAAPPLVSNTVATTTDKYVLGRSATAATTVCSMSLPSTVHQSSMRNQVTSVMNYSIASSVSSVSTKSVIGNTNLPLGVTTSSSKGIIGSCLASSTPSLGSSGAVLSTIASGPTLAAVPVTAASRASLCPILSTASSNLSLGSLPATACNSTIAGNLQMSQSHASVPKHSTTANKSLGRNISNFTNPATSTTNLATTRSSEISFSWGNLTSTSNSISSTKKGTCESVSQFAGQYYTGQPPTSQQTAKFSFSQSNSTFPIVSDSKLLHPVSSMSNTSQSSKDFPFNSFPWYDVSNQLQSSPISMNRGGFEKTPPPPVSTAPSALAGLSLPSFSPSLPNQFTVPALSSFPSSLVSSALTTSSTKNPVSYVLTNPQTNISTATSSQLFQDLSSSASSLPTNLLDTLDFLNPPSTYLSQQYIPPKSVCNKPDAFRGSHDLANITQQNPDSSSSRCAPRIEDALINRLNNTNEIVGNQPFTVNHLMEKAQQIPTTTSHLSASGRTNQQTPKSRCQKTPSVKSQKKSQSESKASKSSKQSEQNKKNCQLKRNDSRASWDGMSLGNKTANKYSAESLLAEKQVHPRGQDASNLAAFGHQYTHYSQQAALPLQPFDSQHQFGNSLHAHNRHGYGVGHIQGQGALPAAYQSWNYIQPVNQITDTNRFGSPGSFAGTNVPHFQDPTLNPHNHAHLAQTMDQLSSSTNYSSHSLHRGGIGSIRGSAPSSHGFTNATTFHQNVQQSKPGTSPGGSKSSSKSKKKTAQDEDIDLGNSIFDPPSSMYFPLPSMNPSEDSQAFISNNFINSRSQLDFHNNPGVPKTQNFLHGHNQGQSLFPWPSNFPMTQERNCLLPSPRVPRHNPSLDAHGITDPGMQMGSSVTNFNVTTICPELNNRSPGSSGNRTSARDATMIPAEYPPPPDPNCIPMIHGGMNLTNILNTPSQVGIGFNPPVTLHGHTLSNMVTNLATTQH